MGNFCKYCGKPLVNGACDCAAAQAQNAGNVQEAAQTYTGNTQDTAQAYTGNTQDTAQAYTGNTQNTAQAYTGNTQDTAQAYTGNAQNTAQAYTGNAQNTAQAYTGNTQNMAQQTQAQPQQGYTNPQQNFQYQQPQGGQAPYVQHQPSMQSQMAKQEAMAAKNLFISALKNPVAILEHISATKKNTSALILGALHLLILLLCTTINIPMLGEFMELGDKVKIGLILLVIAAVPVAITALVAMFTGKKYNPALTYVDALAVFSAATVPGTVIFVGSFIAGLISPLFAMMLLIACYLAWVVLSMEAMNVVCKGGKDKNFWVVLAVHAVIIFVVTLVGKGILEDALKSLSYGSLFNF